MVSEHHVKTAIIGGGNMGAALGRALIETGTVTGCDLFVYEADAARCDKLREELGCNTARAVGSEIKDCGLVVLAVKPQDVDVVCQAVRARISREQIVVSIMAGITISSLQGLLGGCVNIVRAMPNLPLQVGEGMTVYCCGSGFESVLKGSVERLFAVCGRCIEVGSEDLIDAATAISGSGPAYVFYLIEIMVQAACELGFEREQADLLVQQTFIGSVKHLRQGDDTAGILRQKVTSKGGTTEAALQVFSEKGLAEAIAAGIWRAYQRSKELAR